MRNPEINILSAQLMQAEGAKLNRAQRRAAKHNKPKSLRGQINKPSWLDVIQRCKPYDDEPIPGSWLPGTQDVADRSIKLVRDAFHSLKTGSPPDTERDFDLISHALGVSIIRAGQIAGEVIEDNIMLPPLVDANKAMRAVLARRRKWGKWELLAAEAETLDYALEIYEVIVRASSPAQMSEAVDLRREALKGQFLETLETT